ncbi:hypothetical protein ACO3VM_03585 [Methanocaldococcus sp. 10A]
MNLNIKIVIKLRVSRLRLICPSFIILNNTNTHIVLINLKLTNAVVVDVICNRYRTKASTTIVSIIL